METINTAAGKPQNLPRNFTQHMDAAGTSPNRYSDNAGKIFKKEINKNSGIMSNKKVILGIAAGVAALAVTAVILKRKGYLDGVSEKAEEFGGKIKDKYASLKETAGKKFDEVVHKGEEIAEKIKSKAEGKIDAEAANANTATT
jgi:hypothetical protein